MVLLHQSAADSAETPRSTPGAAPSLVTGDGALKSPSRDILGADQGAVGQTDPELPRSSVAARIARSSCFENLTLAVIAVYSLWIAVETDGNTAATLNEAPWGFIVVEHLFCAFFVFEWAVRLLAFRRKRDALKDSWFLFDTLLVVLMVADTWAMFLVVAVTSADGAGGIKSLSVLRLLRLLRLTRMVRLMRLLPEMMIMVKGIASATRSVLITLTLLVIVIYVFAIAFVQLVDDAELRDEYFDNVPRAMYTLMVEGVFPDQASLLQKLSDEAWYFGLLFFLFVMIATLAMINMLVGVLCDTAHNVSVKERERMDIDFIRHKLQTIAEESIDANGDGLISKVEFLSICKMPDASRAMHQVGVDVMSLMEHADFAFDDADDAGAPCERRLSFQEFMELVLKLRGANAATVKDVTGLRKFFHERLMTLEGALFPLGRVPSGPLSLGRSRTPVDRPGAPALEQDEFRARMDKSEDLIQDAAVRSSGEMEDLRHRMHRLEGMVERILQAQLHTQQVLKERLVDPPVAVKPEEQRERPPGGTSAPASHRGSGTPAGDQRMPDAPSGRSVSHSGGVGNSNLGRTKPSPPCFTGCSEVEFGERSR